MVERKDLSKGNELALFVFSKGYCYFPACPVRAFREEGGDMFTQVQRAHIHAVKKGGARWRNLPSHVINSHKNVMLMCQPHHLAIDADEDRYPAELLFAWKAEREGSQMDALRGLEGLSEADFQGMLKGSVTAAKKEIMAALDDLSQEHREIATLLTEFIDNTFTRPSLDVDHVDMLFQASHMLHSMSLPDQTAYLMMAADRLGGFDVEMFSSSTRNLPDLEPFTLAVNKLDNLPDPGYLQSIVSDISNQNQAVEGWLNALPDLTYIDEKIEKLQATSAALEERSMADLVDGERWKTFAGWGFLAGCVATLLLGITLWVLISNSGAS